MSGGKGRTKAWLRPEPEPETFWRSLVKNRAEGRWGTFSWISLSMLLQSANDFLAKQFDPTVVSRARMRWVEAQKARGRDPATPIRLAGEDRLLVVGDPGEMDASQYVLLRDLASVEVESLLLMSDIVYPAGSVNAWRDAVYLPYFGEPRKRWKDALVASKAQFELPDWKVFATPGNHDWYDNLNGFMFNACGADPLPPVAFSARGVTFSQRITRFLWQSPERPNRAALEPLREIASKRSPGAGPGPIPNQPGPYFALDLGGEPDGLPDLRLACVDTGIEGSVDVGQQLWLKELLASPIPTVLVSGKPLVVNDKIGDFPVADDIDTESSLETSVRALVAKHPHVIATLAGDTHNAQRLILAGNPVTDEHGAVLKIDEGVIRDSHEMTLPPVQIIAGGGGAYLSPTHSVRFTRGARGSPVEGDRLTLKDPVKDTPELTLSPGAHVRFPTREQSVEGFEGKVSWKAGIVPLILAAIGVGAALVWRMLGVDLGSDIALPEAGTNPVPERSTFRVVAGGFLGVIFLALAAPAVATMIRRLRDATWTPGTTLLALVVAPLAAGVVYLWWLPLNEVVPMALAFAVVVALPALLLAWPVMNAFPRLRKFVPWKSLLTAAAAAAIAFEQPDRFSAGLLILLIAGAALLVLAAMHLGSRIEQAVREYAIDGTHRLRRLWWRAGQTLTPFILAGLAVYFLPGLLGLGAQRTDLVYFVALTEVLVVIGVLAALAAAAIRRSWRVCPAWMTLVVLAGTAGAGAGVWLQLGWLPGVLAVLATPFVLLGVMFSFAGLLAAPEDSQEKHDQIEAGLRSRDSGRSERTGLWLFRAMVIAGLPMLGEMAEAIKPRFRKSFLIIETERVAESQELIVHFRTYGLDDERTDREEGEIAHGEKPWFDEDKKGSYPVDTLSLRVPVHPNGSFRDPSTASAAAVSQDGDAPAAVEAAASNGGAEASPAVSQA